MRDEIPVVYVFNMQEDVLPFAQTLSDEARELEFRQCATWYTLRELLSFFAEYKDRQEFYFVTPWQIDEYSVQYACDMFGIERRNLHIIVPNNELMDHQGSVSKETLENRVAFSMLPTDRQFDIAAYCMSDQYHELFYSLGANANGIDFTKREDWEIVKRYGTKSGIRELIEQMDDPKIVMPNGKIFYNSPDSLKDAIDYTVSKLQSEGGAVIKIDKAHGGVGVVLIKQKEIQGLDEEHIIGYVTSKLGEAYWEKFNIVVEDLIDIDETKHGGAPNIELRIKEDGNVEVLYVCGLRVEEGKDFTGVEFGNSVFKKDVVEQLVYIGETLGKVYSGLGYRGNFDVDCHIDKEGKIWVGESNIRRTGGTYAYNIALEQFGMSFFRDHYFMTDSVTRNEVRGYSFETLNTILIKKGIGYTKDRGYGVMLTGPEALKDGTLNYIVIADSFSHAKRIEASLNETIHTLH